jgi:hypothetical protein
VPKAPVCTLKARDGSNLGGGLGVLCPYGSLLFAVTWNIAFSAVSTVSSFVARSSASFEHALQNTRYRLSAAYTKVVEMHARLAIGCALVVPATTRISALFEMTSVMQELTFDSNNNYHSSTWESLGARPLDAALEIPIQEIQRCMGKRRWENTPR